MTWRQILRFVLLFVAAMKIDKVQIVLKIHTHNIQFHRVLA